jgi:molybdate/tungstate transport system substrate-binding protein
MRYARLFMLATMGLVFGVFGPSEVPTFSAEPAETGDVIVLRASTLTKPFDEIAKAFMKLHPGVSIKQESAGSVANARKVTDLKKTADIFASADIEVIEKMLMPTYADWYASFASNEMVIAFTDQSRFAKEINDKNWYDILLKKDARWGYANPNADPEGYNTVLMWKLAELYYKQPGLARRIDAHIPKSNIRAHSMAVQGLLEAGEMDYSFQYLSTAKQHHLRYVKLPDEINLGSVAKRALYATVEVQLAGKVPGQTMTKKGTPIVYGITILKEAPNPAAAAAFVKFILSDAGRQAIADNYQTPINPPVASDAKRVPEALESALAAGSQKN